MKLCLGGILCPLCRKPILYLGDEKWCQELFEYWMKCPHCGKKFHPALLTDNELLGELTLNLDVEVDEEEYAKNLALDVQTKQFVKIFDDAQKLVLKGKSEEDA